MWPWVVAGVGAAVAFWFANQNRARPATSPKHRRRQPTERPRAFISFDFDNDANQKHLFSGQARNERIPFDISDWSSKEALSERVWQQAVSAKLAQCHLVIVLVGPQTANAHGVRKEIEMAKAHRVPVIGVYVRGANERTRLPRGLARKRVVHWKWPDVAAAVRGSLRRGKHRN